MTAKTARATRAIVGADLHFPSSHKPTVATMLDFVRDVHPAIFVFLGDQFDNQCISHHTKGQPGLRSMTTFRSDTDEFARQVLNPLEAALPKSATKVWIKGNHDFWVNDIYAEQPELRGQLDRERDLRLAERGWTIVECGKAWKFGKLTFIHGETLTTQFHSKKAVETFCRNVVYGHFHSPQSFTKVLPSDESQKWSATCLPILGDLNPSYMRNKPSGWVNGFGVVEFHGSEGSFNLYPVITINGRCAYGGEIYGNKN
jgi:predicted phosphodiesterase